jgi:hypothetical protein
MVICAVVVSAGGDSAGDGSALKQKQYYASKDDITQSNEDNYYIIPGFFPTNHEFFRFFDQSYHDLSPSPHGGSEWVG